MDGELTQEFACGSEISGLTAREECLLDEEISHVTSETLSIGCSFNEKRMTCGRKKTFCPSQFRTCHLVSWIAVLFVLHVFVLMGPLARLDSIGPCLIEVRPIELRPKPPGVFLNGGMDYTNITVCARCANPFLNQRFPRTESPYDIDANESDVLRPISKAAFFQICEIPGHPESLLQTVRPNLC